MQSYDQKGMNLVARTSVHSVEPPRDKPIYARPATPRRTLLNRTVPQNLRPTTPVANLRLLVIDDCHANADSLVFMLSYEGYETKAVYSAAEGLEAAERFRPDMLICALLSTGMSGFESATSIRRIVPACKVILFSPPLRENYLDQRVEEMGLDCELINEPLHPQELLSKIKARIG